MNVYDIFVNGMVEAAGMVVGFIGAGVGLGAVVFAVFLGIRSGYRALSNMAYTAKHGAEDEEFWKRYDWAIEHGFNDDEASMYARGEEFNHSDTTGIYYSGR